jgi:hypothetical protein
VVVSVIDYSFGETGLPVENFTCVRDISRNVKIYYFVCGAMIQVIQGVSD